MMPAGAQNHGASAPCRIALQHLLPAQGELVDGGGDFAHLPRQGFADHRFQILVHQHKAEPARAQLQPPLGFRRRIGVGHQNDIAVLQRRVVHRQKFHLAQEIGVVRAVGEDDNGSCQIKLGIQRNLRRRMRPEFCGSLSGAV